MFDTLVAIVKDSSNSAVVQVLGLGEGKDHMSPFRHSFKVSLTRLHLIFFMQDINLFGSG